MLYFCEFDLSFFARKEQVNPNPDPNPNLNVHSTLTLTP